MFSNLSKNSHFFILEKSDGLKLIEAVVDSIAQPHPRYNNPSQPFGQLGMETVVDVTVRAGDDVREFKDLPTNQAVATYNGSTFVTDSREAALAEVEGIERSSRQIIESVPYHESVLSDCDSVKARLNPQLAKEKQQAEKIASLEGKISGIESSQTKMMGMLERLLGSKP